MLLLTRYLLTLFLRNTLLALATFGGIYLLIDFFEKVDDFISAGAPPALYFTYFLSTLPLIIVQLTALALLMGAFMTIGGLSRSGELTAMRAGGLSLLRITRPLLLAAVAITALIILVQEMVLPLSTRYTREVFDQRIRGNQEITTTRHQIWLRVDNRIIHIGQADPDSGELRQVTYYSVDPLFRVSNRVDAAYARFKDNAWTLHKVVERTFDPDSGEMASSRQSAEAPFALGKMPDDFRSTDLRQWELNFFDLRRLVRQLQNEGSDPTRYRVDMHSHLASPFACLVMVLLGIPFALQRGRNSSLAMGIVVSIATGVTYFILHSMTIAFGYSGILPPFVATWAANVLFGLTGLWFVLFRKQ